jgi:hypothetical protein
MKEKDFDEWNETKKSTNNKNYPLHFKERDIFHILFIGVPLTTAAKDDMFHFKFSFLKDKESYAILSQIRAFDANRLERELGKIRKEDFESLKEKLSKLLKLCSPQ